MPHRFILMKYLNDHHVIECNGKKLDAVAKQQIIDQLCSGAVEFVYHCDDTSADAAFKIHSEKYATFSTYFIISTSVDQGNPSLEGLKLSAVRHINNANYVNTIDSNERFQLLTYDT